MPDYPRFELTGQIALVTGASRGIGRAIALARDGPLVRGSGERGHVECRILRIDGPTCGVDVGAKQRHEA